MKLNYHQTQRRIKDILLLRELNEKGYSLREIAKVIGRSHEWVRSNLTEVKNIGAL